MKAIPVFPDPVFPDSFKCCRKRITCDKMFWSKPKCHFCKKEIEKGKEIRAKVEVYGLVGEHRRDFCSDECLDRYREMTEQLMKTRRPRVCTRCLR